MPTTTSYVNTRKRKSSNNDDDVEANGPRKIAALGTSRPIRGRPGAGVAKGPLVSFPAAGNLASSTSNSTSTSSIGNDKSTGPGVRPPTMSSSNFGKGLPKSVVRPRAATLARPPTSTNARTVRPTTSAARKQPARGPTSSASGQVRIIGAAAKRAAGAPTLNNIQSQLASLEEARKADAERLAQEMDAERSKVSQLQANHLALSNELAEKKALELAHRRELVNFTDELEDMRKKHRAEVMELEMDLRKKERECREALEDLRLTKSDLEQERVSNDTLRTTLSTQTQTQLTLSAENEALKAQLGAVQRALEERNAELAEMQLMMEEKDRAVVEMKKEVFESELIRRKLHNQVLELKGNIRVFCRVRPVLASDVNKANPTDADLEKAQANMVFPDDREQKEIILHSKSESAMGIERKEVYNFGFDRVFPPSSTQHQVFEEISQLAQSCIDGYNVCIFAYGQTGSGKSWTMEGGQSDAAAGMIPRAVEQVFRVANEMKSKGWVYTIEGQFLEIYNENIHDLLDAPSPSARFGDDKKRHEIKHDLKTGRTTVTELTVVPLHSASQVKHLLAQAARKRSVAATLMNERSSRSHSVFTLRISGVNVGVGAAESGTNSTAMVLEGSGADELAGTGERCEGCLNLVDLAGSERLNVSFGPGVTEKERVKETQAINKSLSALGDVISALGERGGGREQGHIPYRNSKLTYLLQNSLSGSSKTLMVLNLSPLAAHLSESLTSLRFATKVNNTQIGTAKKQARS